MTLVSKDNERIRAHNVVLVSVNTPSGNIFKNDDKNTYYKIIHIKGFFLHIYDVWCTMQNLC